MQLGPLTQRVKHHVQSVVRLHQIVQAFEVVAGLVPKHYYHLDGVEETQATNMLRHYAGWLNDHIAECDENLNQLQSFVGESSDVGIRPLPNTGLQGRGQCPPRSPPTATQSRQESLEVCDCKPVPNRFQDELVDFVLGNTTAGPNSVLRIPLHFLGAMVL